VAGEKIICSKFNQKPKRDSFKLDVAAVKAYSKRSGIEAMFKDCKTGGYNLEKCQASKKRLSMDN
jgi:hypothetical protein